MFKVFVLFAVLGAAFYAYKQLTKKCAAPVAVVAPVAPVAPVAVDPAPVAKADPAPVSKDPNVKLP
jgi:hypothetical protein